MHREASAELFLMVGDQTPADISNQIENGNLPNPKIDILPNRSVDKVIFLILIFKMIHKSWSIW